MLTAHCFQTASRWASQAELEQHHTKEYLHQTHKTLENEDLLAHPEEIKSVVEVEAFWER